MWFVCFSQQPVFFVFFFDNVRSSQLQYPLRPTTNPQSHDYASARMRPKQQSLELTVPLQMNAEHYDEKVGREIALKVAEATPGARLDAGLFDSIKLKSTRVPIHTHYAVGVLQNGELHLNPVRWG